MTTAVSADDGTPAHTVLLVDDEFDTRFVVRLLLEDAGYTVLEAINGRDALRQLDEATVDLVVTDVDMPDMDGPTLVRRLRQEPGTAELPILAWGEREPEELPVDGTLPKGAGVRRLIGEVGRLLGHKET